MMETLNFEQMEQVNGGRDAAQVHNECIVGAAVGVVLTGVGFVAATMAGPVGWLALGLAYGGLGLGLWKMKSC